MIRRTIAVGVVAALSTAATFAAEPFSVARCELIPLPDHQASLRVEGRELARWHHGAQYPRPFFFPIVGPSGGWLTRMGHPGAPNHDHHRSVWFAHHDIEGVDFWSDAAGAQVRQKSWLAYRDGQQETLMAVSCGWFDDAQNELLDQELVAAVMPLNDQVWALEFQLTLRPGANRDSVRLGKTNFGLLAIRVAKSISVHFGGGQITSSDGQQGETAIFGKAFAWVDYSGPVAVGSGTRRQTLIQGITCFDHPQNPRYPTHWHVREDGWMGASFCMQDAYQIDADQPLCLRYLIAQHRGPYQSAQATEIAEAFAARPGFQVSSSSQPHLQYEVRRLRAAER